MTNEEYFTKLEEFKSNIELLTKYRYLQDEITTAVKEYNKLEVEIDG